jgi:hypothetical protein
VLGEAERETGREPGKDTGDGGYYTGGDNRVHGLDRMRVTLRLCFDGVPDGEFSVDVHLPYGLASPERA